MFPILAGVIATFQVGIIAVKGHKIATQNHAEAMKELPEDKGRDRSGERPFTFIDTLNDTQYGNLTISGDRLIVGGSGDKWNSGCAYIHTYTYDGCSLDPVTLRGNEASESFGEQTATSGSIWQFRLPRLERTSKAE